MAEEGAAGEAEVAREEDGGGRGRRGSTDRPHRGARRDVGDGDRPRGRRGRPSLGAGIAGGAATLALLISRLVRLIVGLVVALIVIGILLRVLDANASNSIVSTVHDAAKALVGPFKDVFTEKDPKLSIAVNWGLAAFVYLIVGSVIAILIGRIGSARAAGDA